MLLMLKISILIIRFYSAMMIIFSRKMAVNMIFITRLNSKHVVKNAERLPKMSQQRLSPKAATHDVIISLF